MRFLIVVSLYLSFCRILLARLEYLRDTFQIKEGDFLTFDALVCLGVIKKIACMHVCVHGALWSNLRLVAKIF